MTVRDLAQKLSECDPDARVIFANHGSSYTMHGAQRGGGRVPHVEKREILEVVQRVIPSGVDAGSSSRVPAESFKVVLLSSHLESVERAAWDLECFGI